MQVEKLASAIYNDVVSGLSGITSNPTMDIYQLQDDVVDMRLQIIKEYSLKDLIPKKDLLMSINCINVDCLSLDKCCSTSNYSKPVAHCEIPQLLNDFGNSSVEYFGATDKQVPFKVYMDTSFKYHHLKLRGKDKPYIFIDVTPNSNNMLDCFLFNVPLLKRVSIMGIFKDLRQLDNFDCCNAESNNMTFIDMEIKKRLTELKLRYYRQLYYNPTPNTQAPK